MAAAAGRPALAGRLKKIMSFLCLLSGSVLPPAGKFQAVSLPVGYHCSGTTPDEVKVSSSRWRLAALLRPSRSGWASAGRPPR